MWTAFKCLSWWVWERHSTITLAVLAIARLDQARRLAVAASTAAGPKASLETVSQKQSRIRLEHYVADMKLKQYPSLSKMITSFDYREATHAPMSTMFLDAEMQIAHNIVTI